MRSVVVNTIGTDFFFGGCHDFRSGGDSLEKSDQNENTFAVSLTAAKCK